MGDGNEKHWGWETARFLDAIIDNIPNMVFVKDAERLSFVLFNRAGEDLLGVPREQLIGKNDYDFFPESEAKFFQDKDRQTLAAKALVDIPEEPIQTQRGERFLHTRKVPILDAKGEPRYLLGISEDITDAKHAAEERARLMAEIETANRELEAFSYSVAHDLRTPLRSIDGFSQALVEDYGDSLDPGAQRYLKLVRESAQHMARLIDDLLALARVSRTELRAEPVDLSALARAANARIERAHPDRTVDLVIADGLRARGDPRLLALIFDNLLGNAWKFTSKRDGARIEVGETTTETGERAFFVRDNGAGFDMMYVDRLFGVFQRLHSTREFEGTGIGLVTVQRVIRRHGGRVWAEGAVDRGATIYFTLPETP